MRKRMLRHVGRLCHVGMSASAAPSIVSVVSACLRTRYTQEDFVLDFEFQYDRYKQCPEPRAQSAERRAMSIPHVITVPFWMHWPLASTPRSPAASHLLSKMINNFLCRHPMEQIPLELTTLLFRYFSYMRAHNVSARRMQISQQTYLA